jgi:hypothetical protein
MFAVLGGFNPHYRSEGEEEAPRIGFRCGFRSIGLFEGFIVAVRL